MLPSTVDQTGPITMSVHVKFQSPEGRERLLRLSPGRREVPYRRPEAKIFCHFPTTKMKAGKQRKNVVKTL